MAGLVMAAGTMTVPPNFEETLLRCTVVEVWAKTAAALAWAENDRGGLRRSTVGHTPHTRLPLICTSHQPGPLYWIIDAHIYSSYMTNCELA